MARARAASASAVLSAPQVMAAKSDGSSARATLGGASYLGGALGRGESSVLTTSLQLSALLPPNIPVFLDPSTGRFRAALGESGSARPEGGALGAAAIDPVSSRQRTPNGRQSFSFLSLIV
mmetsp:Transcript_17030/g.39286  ORF Transcript_17030/g.39286 Transcript_17030/m.39286 type:complete len:121 (-) Transcript_17030:175-537(-)